MKLESKICISVVSEKLIILIYLYFSNVWKIYIKITQMLFFYIRSD